MNSGEETLTDPGDELGAAWAGHSVAPNHSLEEGEAYGLHTIGFSWP